MHGDVIKWKHFPRYRPFVQEIRHTKASDAELWCFFFYLRLNKRLSKQWWAWWFDMLWRPLWRHRNGNPIVYMSENRQGAHFTNNFSILIQIWWKLGFSVNPIYSIISLHNVAYITTAQRSWHVRNSIVVACLQLRWEQDESFHRIWITMENRAWNGPLVIVFPLTSYIYKIWNG